ncbi:unnamed protein product [Symbiodinium sp. CCMP2456]|nr:unnamed protein product [Symbiodinium sp. CCMP2456]
MLTIASFSSLWLPRIVQVLSGPAALKALRCCRSLKKLWPQCLQAGEGFWILEELKKISLEQLLARDEDLCNCFRRATRDMGSCHITYWLPFRTVEIYTSMPTPESESRKETAWVDRHRPTPQLVVRSLSESFEAMHGNESLELTKRILALPATMSQQLPELFAGGLKVVGKESPALVAMGVGGWEVSNTCETCRASDWLHFGFHRPKPKVPLAIFHLSGKFDLPGGDGGCKVSLGYVSTDLDYVVALRDFSEFPIRRHLSSKVTTRWEEVEGLLQTRGLPGPSLPSLSREGTKTDEILAKITTPEGWEVEHTTMYMSHMSETRCAMGAPYLDAIYRDAKRLAKSGHSP